MDVIRQHIREVPDFPKPGILFYDITTLLQTPAAYREAIRALVDRYADKELDRIVAIESRGFLFGAPLSDRLGVPLALVRKPGKLPYEKVGKQYALEYGTDTIEMHVDAVQEGQRVLIVDDLLATGGTAAAAVSLVRDQGAEVVECAFVIELTFLDGRTKLHGAPVHALVSYQA